MSISDEIIRQLELKPHPEGGFYRETYRSGEKPPGGKAASTAIYYLLVPGAVSHFHRLANDEIFHFYQGDVVEWFFLKKSAPPERHLLGPIDKGGLPQLVVPAGTWFAGRLAGGGAYSLMGTTVAPGFEFSDFELGDRGALLRLFPESSDIIEQLS